jgi:hypothetical protein
MNFLWELIGFMNIYLRLLPKDDAQKAEPVDEETMKKIMRGEI